MSQTTANTMRSVVLVTALLPIALSSAWSQKRVVLETSDEFSVQVTAEGSGSSSPRNPRVDFGIVSREKANSTRHTSSAAATYSITRRIQLRVSRKNPGMGLVMVQAYLLQDCYPCRLKFDGTELGTSPIVVMNGAELNRTSEHRLEIEIPVSMSPGAINAEIGWQVEQQ